MKFLENFLSNFAVLPITNEILESAYEIFKDNFLKTKIGFADALISATAIFFDIPLASRNKKHYQTITRLKFILPY